VSEVWVIGEINQGGMGRGMGGTGTAIKEE